ncbi:carboxylesterase family protein [Actinomycetes bacterium KLBMP 9797]
MAAAFATGTMATPASASSVTVVATDHGLMRGVTADGVRTFQGIPFAAPPVGDLRWKAPRPARPWRGVRDASKPASPCPQTPNGEVTDGSVNEDCLYLNVTTPAGTSNQPLPVIVWLHGGGFTSGAGSSYDAKRLATKGRVAVVTVNYRLGVFGNLAYPGLPDGGTFGLLDQLTALRWVRANAAAFGADPRNVTAAGESAGAMSICALLTSPKAKGGFDKAVMESGSCLLNWTKNTWYVGMDGFTPYLSTEDANVFATEAANQLDCTDPADAVDCLRGKNVEQLLHSPLPFNAPTYGNHLLPVNPADAVRAGNVHRLPLLSGGTRDEANGAAAALEAAGHLTEPAYQALLADSFGADAAKIAARYPTGDYQSPAAAWGAVATDRAWACPTLQGNKLLANRAPTYAFEFADRTAPALLPAPPGFPLGAAHAHELAYLFDLGGYHLLTTPAQEQLANQMIGYWSNFARSGNPNGATLPRWQPVRAGDPRPYAQSLESGTGFPGRVDLSTRHHCDLWRTIPTR